MKNIKNKFIKIVAVFSFMFLGCESEILDKDPTTTISDNAVWSSIDLAADYLNSAYNDGIETVEAQRWPTSITDDACQRGNQDMWQFTTGSVTPSSFGYATFWKKYNTIRIVNFFLENIDQLAETNLEEVSLLKAEARFIRAKCYADLVNFYSWWEGEENGVPLITQSHSVGDDYEVARSNYDDVIEFIVSELDEAMEDLPAVWDDSEWGKPTKGACMALKSRQLLYAASKLHNPGNVQAEWQKASDAAFSLITDPLYSLVQADTWQDYTNIWLDTDNSEIILALPRNSDEAANWDLQQSPNGYRGRSGNCPTQDLVDDFEMEDGQSIQISPLYDEQDPYINRDMRFYANIVYNGRMYRGREVEFFYPEDGSSVAAGVDSRASNLDQQNASPTGYTLYKYMDESIDIQETSSSVPWIIFRLAEMYLNYAEAQFHLGNEGVAKEYVNKVRGRAKMPDITSAGNQLLEDIRHERRIELVFENYHRFCDVRRWEIVENTLEKDVGQINIYKDDAGNLRYERSVFQERTFQPKSYNFPIPLSEREKAPWLKQNPNY